MNKNLHVFMYNWWKTLAVDGVDRKWFDGKDGQFGSPYTPKLGVYSSFDPEIIKKQLTEIKNAGIGTVVASWWGSNEYTNTHIQILLPIAHKLGIDVALHLEPVYGSDQDVAEQMDYFLRMYGNHPALAKREGKIIVYVYDSYKLTTPEWQTFHGAFNQFYTIGLYVNEGDENRLHEEGFSGAYSYFGNRDHTYGSTVQNWLSIRNALASKGMEFSPSVAPGYNDTLQDREVTSITERDNGLHYNHMWTHAINCDPEFISVCSYNENLEGTQIESSMEFPGCPSFYMDLTKQHNERWNASK